MVQLACIKYGCMTIVMIILSRFLTDAAAISFKGLQFFEFREQHCKVSISDISIFPHDVDPVTARRAAPHSLYGCGGACSTFEVTIHLMSTFV